MTSLFRHALLSGVLLVMPASPAFAAADPVADENAQSRDKAEIVVTGSVATQSSAGIVRLAAQALARLLGRER